MQLNPPDGRPALATIDAAWSIFRKAFFCPKRNDVANADIPRHLNDHRFGRIDETPRLLHQMPMVGNIQHAAARKIATQSKQPMSLNEMLTNVRLSAEVATAYKAVD